MTNLTEKWKKGELPEGYYYCKTENGVEILRTWRGIDGYLNFENMCNEVFISSMRDCEILAEVPSFEEWQQLKKWCEEFNALEVAKENTKLKENIHSMLFTDDVVQDRYDKAKRENKELKLLVAEAWAYFKASLPCLYGHWIEKADKILGEDK